MRRGPRKHSLVLGALALTLALAPARSLAAPSDSAPPNPDPATKDAARAEVKAGSAAFSAGDYATAIAHYEAAIALLPAPKLHYNIAVCHQRLSLEAETSPERTRERDLAIESYNAYLEQNPQAEDRLEVAETIRELGGTPVTMPRLKPLFDEQDPSDAGETGEGETGESETGESETDTGETAGAGETDEPPAQRPYPSHGRFGVTLVGGYSPTMANAAAVDAPGLFALDLHAGGFLGKRRRFLLAAHTALFTGATLDSDGLTFYGYSLGLIGEQTWVLGDEAVQIGFGGLAALTGQGIGERQNAPAPVCSLEGVQVAGRTGALLAPRFDLGILMGPRRRAMISLLVQPSFAVFGDGRTVTACQADETPWTVLGIRRRWQFQLWAGAGFGLRF